MLCLSVSFPTCPWVIHTTGCKMPTRKCLHPDSFLREPASGKPIKVQGKCAETSWEWKDMKTAGGFDKPTSLQKVVVQKYNGALVFVHLH